MVTHNFTYRSATLKLTGENDVFTLSNLVAGERRKGHASELVRFMCDIADDNGWTIQLTAHRFGRPPGPDTKTLVAFYRKYGFKPTTKNRRGPIKMERQPKERNNG